MYLRQCCKTSVILLFIILTIPYSIHAVGISNGGFESSGIDWTPNTSTLIFDIDTNDPYNGSASAKITYGGASSRGIEQTVLGISGGEKYIISGVIKLDSADMPDTTYIRIAWYSSTDATGIQLSTSPSRGNNNNGAVITTSWSPVKFTVQAPNTAQSAEIRLYVQNGSAYFDNISFTKEPNQTEVPTTTPTGATAAPSSVPTIPTISITPPQPTATQGQVSANSPTPTVPTNPTPTAQQTSYDNIYISEAMVAPNTGGVEWIELYNGNNFDVALTSWYIDDVANGGSAPRSFSLSLPAYGYGFVDMTSAIFNNSGDAVRLLNSAQTLKHEFSYISSEKGYSWGAQGSTYSTYCIQLPSKGIQNTGCISPSEDGIATPTAQPPSPTAASTLFSRASHAISRKSPSKTQRYYRIIVTPPLTQTKQKNYNVKGATTVISHVKPPGRRPNRLSFLASSYSLLSGISLGLKVYFKHVSNIPI